MSSPTHRPVRPARAADLRHLAGIEDAGGAMFEDAFGDLSGDALLSPATRGVDRAAEPGFLLVVGPVGAPVGFVHVLLLDGEAHLEQLSVLPDVMRRGLGSALVRAAMREAYRDGHRELSLCTYRDLAWNGPFYRGLGFAEVAGLAPFQRDLREHERRLGLDRHGVRVVMSAPLHRQVTDE